MQFLNKKNKIEFFNSDPSVIDNYPIIESKELNLNWVKKVREDLQNHIMAYNYLHFPNLPP